MTTTQYHKFGEEDSGESTSEEGSDDSAREQEQSLSSPKKKPPALGGEKPGTSALHVIVGSGLKRPFTLDENGEPLIAKRGKKASNTYMSSGSKLKTDFSNGSLSERANTTTGIDSLPAAIEGRPVVLLEENENDLDARSSLSHEGGLTDDNMKESSEASTHDRNDEVRQPDVHRIAAFKAWADQQRKRALGFESITSPPQSVARSGNNVQTITQRSRTPDQDPLPAELEIKDSDRKAFAVDVERDAEIQAHRMALPVVMEEQRVMEAIHNHPTVVVCGATGSGKTTQIPQFLFEAGYGNPNSHDPGIIGVTQPRRVAAVSMAKRVAMELGSHSDRVAYKVKFFIMPRLPLADGGSDSLRRLCSSIHSYQIYDRRDPAAGSV